MSLPPSYENSKTLTGFDGETEFLWNEVGGSYSTLDIRLSRDQNSAATMTFYTDWSNIVDDEKFAILGRTIVGGYDSESGNKIVPYQFPLFPKLYAKDIVGIHGLGPIGSTEDDPVAPYTLAAITISFESVPYSFDEGEGSEAFSLAWIERKGNSSNQRVNTTYGAYRYLSGPSTGKCAQNGVVLYQSTLFDTFVIHSTPYNYLFNSSGQFQWGDFGGKVNFGTFFGYPEGELLLDSITYDPYADWDGTIMYNTNLNFVSLKIIGAEATTGNWNSMPDYTGGVYPIGLSDGTPPYSLYDFSDLMADINPLNS